MIEKNFGLRINSYMIGEMIKHAVMSTTTRLILMILEKYKVLQCKDLETVQKNILVKLIKFQTKHHILYNYTMIKTNINYSPLNNIYHN